LERNPFEGERIHPGPYRLGKRVEDANTYRIGHPLAERILSECKALPTETKTIRFDYRGSGKRIAAVESLVGREGWLLCTRAALTAFETEDHLLFAGVTDGGDNLDHAQCRRLFDIPGVEAGPVCCDAEVRRRCEEQTTAEIQRIGARLAEKNGGWFDAEMDKLDRWADDQRRSRRLKRSSARREAPPICRQNLTFSASSGSLRASALKRGRTTMNHPATWNGRKTAFWTISASGSTRRRSGKSFS
jgi:hypothetical protein